jgi:hypothetical protein
MAAEKAVLVLFSSVFHVARKFLRFPCRSIWILSPFRPSIFSRPLM